MTYEQAWQIQKQRFFADIIKYGCTGDIDKMIDYYEELALRDRRAGDEWLAIAEELMEVRNRALRQLGWID